MSFREYLNETNFKDFIKEILLFKDVQDLIAAKDKKGLTNYILEVYNQSNKESLMTSSEARSIVKSLLK